MINLLLTSKGERLSNPNFGSNLKYILFEQNDQAIILKIQDAIQEAVAEFMPYVDIQEIDVDRYNGGEDQSANILASVCISVIGNN